MPGSAQPGGLRACSCKLGRGRAVDPGATGDGGRSYPTAVPIAIGALKYNSQKDFERQPPGFGRGYAFSSDFARMDVFVYSLGLARVPTPDDVEQALGGARTELDVAVRKGHYSKLKALETFSLRVGKRRIRCQSFSLVGKSFGDTASSLCVGVGYGQLLKVRLSMRSSSVKAHPPKAILAEAYRQFDG
jgi:hypothetical protein